MCVSEFEVSRKIRRHEGHDDVFDVQAFRMCPCVHGASLTAIRQSSRPLDRLVRSGLWSPSPLLQGQPMVVWRSRVLFFSAWGIIATAARVTAMLSWAAAPLGSPCSTDCPSTALSAKATRCVIAAGNTGNGSCAKAVNTSRPIAVCVLVRFITKAT